MVHSYTSNMYLNALYYSVLYVFYYFNFYLPWVPCLILGEKPNDNIIIAIIIITNCVQRRMVLA